MFKLTSTQRRMIAASLEIDQRPDVAARAAIGGHVSEFQYRRGVPASTKAQALADLQAAITGALWLLGPDVVIAALRA